jgi:CheY-like chemotaxis protein
MSQMSKPFTAKVLLVENNKSNAQVISDYLGANNCDVCYVDNGLDALKMIRIKEFDIVILELRLPEQNGFMTTEQIRQTPIGATVPIIIMSEFVDQHNQFRVYTAGANFFLEKPISPQKLFFIIKNLLIQQEHKFNFLSEREKYRDDAMTVTP